MPTRLNTTVFLRAPFILCKLCTLVILCVFSIGYSTHSVAASATPVLASVSSSMYANKVSLTSAQQSANKPIAAKKSAKSLQKSRSTNFTHSTKGLEKFSAKALGLKPEPKKKKIPVAFAVDKKKTPTSLYVNASSPTTPQGKISFEGGKEEQDNFIGPRRTALPGGKNTLSQMDTDSPQEMAIRYKMDKQSTARLAINQQDKTSPLYSPIEEADTIAATGMYIDVNVKKDLQFQMGAEVRNHEGATESSTNSQGASVGLRWAF